jgi:acyl-CoA synthetase (AMP-forming)/AMP-acid ligase II
MHARAQPETEALVSGVDRLSYLELDSRVDQLCAGLTGLGLARGDRVAALLGNRQEFIILYLACARLGLVFVPINPRLSEREVGFIVEDCDASVFVADSDRASAATATKDSPPHVVTLADDSTDALTFQDLLITPPGSPTNPRDGRSSQRAPVTVIYTSGTTGRPKGVMLTHGGQASYVRSAVAVGLFQPGDRVLIQVPLATAAGTAIQVPPAIHVGATLVLLDAFKAAKSLAMIEAERISCFVAPPTMFILQLDLPEFDQFDLSSIRQMITGAAPVSTELAARIVDAFPGALSNSYGATETGGLVTYVPADAPRDKVIGTCGISLPGCEVRIVNEAREPLGSGVLGEIAVRAGSVMRGYLDASEASKPVLDADGYWYSGDIGKRDSEGYVSVVGRKKEMYIRGGFNISPAEVEGVLQAHPGVAMCAVAPYPDPVLGERGRAFVVPKGEEKPDRGELKVFCEARLADYKVPDEIVFVETLPTTGPGKIDRRALRELAAA